MTDIDPVTFEIIRHRLFRVTDEAMAALKRVSGSPTTNEGHDLLVALCTSEGDLLTAGMGYLQHLTPASRAVKHILHRFAGDIEEGDVFLLNDPYTAALHAPDMFIIKPIYFEGTLRAFSASFVHASDIGAIDPGGFTPRSESVFHEGFQTPGLKIAEDREVRDDVIDTILNMSRAPDRVNLDLRSQIAANNVAEERLHSLMEEYTPERVEAVSDRLIEQSEEKIRDRLAELPDGVWQARQYIDSAREEKVFEIVLTLRKEGASLAFEFSGTDEQSETGLNCALPATRGGVIAPFLALVCRDVVLNDGVIRPIDIEAPEGSIVNASRPAPLSIATVGTVHTVTSLSTIVLSKMLCSLENYRDEATAVWHGAPCSVRLETEIDGKPAIEGLTDTFAGAGGARTFKDGVDLGGQITNGVTRWGNVERHEQSFPIRYLFRRFLTDSGGAGTYRGGLGHEFALTPLEPDGPRQIKTITFGKGELIPLATGLSGGHPGTTVSYAIHKDTDVWDRRVGEYHPGEGGTDGEVINARWGVNSLEAGDVFRVGFAGSGGYADPLRRDPEGVARDVREGKVDPETARSVYGVPIDDRGETDHEAVERTREEIRDDRISRADDATAPPTPGAVQPTEYWLGGSLRMVEDAEDPSETFLACASCESVVAPLGDGWKEYAPRLTRRPAEIGLHRAADETAEVREFVCPACGTLLDTEVAFAGDSTLDDSLVFPG